MKKEDILKIWESGDKKRIFEMGRKLREAGSPFRVVYSSRALLETLPNDDWHDIRYHLGGHHMIILMMPPRKNKKTRKTKVEIREIIK